MKLAHVRRHVADGERLPEVAEHDVLVGDEPGQPEGVDRDVALHQLGRAGGGAGGRVELRGVVVLDDLRRGEVPGGLGGEAHHEDGADGEVGGHERVGRPALGRGAQRLEVEAGRADHDVAAGGEHRAARSPARCRAA